MQKERLNKMTGKHVDNFQQTLSGFRNKRKTIFNLWIKKEQIMNSNTT